MDCCIEQLVKKKWDIYDFAKVLLILLATLAVIFFIVLVCSTYAFLDMFVYFFIVVAVYFSCRFILDISTEFEYSFFDGELTVDMISAKRKRKNIAVIRISNIEKAGKVSSCNLSDIKKQIFAASERNGDNYCLIFKGSSEEPCALIFSPNDKIYKAVTRRLPRHAIEGE